MNFKHSGDLGDIICALPAIKALGGGTLYLDPEGGANEPCVNNGLLFQAGRGREGRDRKTKLTKETIAQIKPILECQPYIQGVEMTGVPWQGDEYANLDTFRIYVGEDKTIVDSHCEAMMVRPPNVMDAWLTAPRQIPLTRPILLSRSLRYHGNDEFWVGLHKKLLERACFIGLPFEYQVFRSTFPLLDVPYYRTESLMDLFLTIASADRVITNQGLIHAIAEGLKKSVILEVYRNSRRCVFDRPGAIYV